MSCSWTISLTPERTLDSLVQHVGELGANSVRTAVLLHKQRETTVDLRPDFVAFEIPDEFVVGYGLDYQDHYRNLPFLGILEPEDLHRPPLESVQAMPESRDG